MNSPSHTPWARLRGLMGSRKQPGAAAEARLLKLATWLSTRGELVTRQQVYEAFPDDYAGKDEAREKKWTRDKLDLKRLGIPV